MNRLAADIFMLVHYIFCCRMPKRRRKKRTNADNTTHHNPRTLQMKASPADLRLCYMNRPTVSLPGVPGTQTYFSALEKLFPSLVDTTEVKSPTLVAAELIVDISANGISTVENITDHRQRQTPTWIRTVHLVPPISYMDGTCIIPEDGALPVNSAPWKRTLRKINDPNNEAYTDAVMACMASRLVETGRSPHFCRFFGTFNGRVPEYSYDITDDMSDIEDKPWFAEGLKAGAFRVIATDSWNDSVTTEIAQPLAPAFRKVIEAADATETAVEAEEVAAFDCSADSSDDTEIVEITDAVETSGSAIINRPSVNLKRLSGSDSSFTDSLSSDSDDVSYHVIIKNYPVQMTVLERCEGTLDDLMAAEFEGEDDTSDPSSDSDSASASGSIDSDDRWAAWIFQVIAGLTVAQQAYNFVHNDLHTNNVMWSSTDEPYLFYRVGDAIYRVPTYGRIMKIIDFGRATFTPQGGSAWISDAYAPDGDAHGQYNCGDYYQKKNPKVGPNRSFDLCRLAISMLETIWPETPADAEPERILTQEPGRTQYETVSPLWNLLWKWLTDKNGKNLLLKPNGVERYPDFDLYCAIARDAKHAVPAQQLTLPIFANAFRCDKKEIPSGATVWNLN